ncbi:MAG: SHOCT domain-containing protein [Clostridia bacterium]|nr:SHOCT domain-containing protein [Clostridia bacterium]
MKEVRFLLQGKKSALFVYDDRVLIIRKSSEPKSASIYKNILFCDIESVLVVPSGQDIGRIEFCISAYSRLEKAKDTVKNGNVFQFKNTKSKQENLTAYAIKSYIEEEIRKNIIKRKVVTKFIAEGILAFKQLLDCGAISKEEFERKKKEILET